MAPPKQLPRWQLIDGAILIILGLFVCASTWWFNAQDRNTRDCLEQQFGLLSRVLDIRGDLQQAESEATQHVLVTAASAKNSTEIFAALQQYQSTIEAIQTERTRNPVPPYPLGTCDNPRP